MHDTDDYQLCAQPIDPLVPPVQGDERKGKCSKDITPCRITKPTWGDFICPHLRIEVHPQSWTQKILALVVGARIGWGYYKLSFTRLSEVVKYSVVK